MMHRYRFTCGYNDKDGEQAAVDIRALKKIRNMKEAVLTFAESFMPVGGESCHVDEWEPGHVVASFYGDQPDGYDGPYAWADLWELPDPHSS